MDAFSTSEASTQVANTYELVENILIQLREISPASVVKSQAVSKTFQHVYARSHQLQTCLPMHSSVDSRGSERGLKIEPLPKIFADTCVAWPEPFGAGWEYKLAFEIDSQELASGRWREGGSWRPWLVCRSSTTTIKAVVDGIGEHNPGGVTTNGGYDISLNLDCKTGITFGQLVDAAHELADLDGKAPYLQVDFKVMTDHEGRPVSKEAFSLKGRRSIGFRKAMDSAWQIKKLWDGFEPYGVEKEQ
ncbi:hypothetical protein CLAFUW4_02355 [Fulvia fulva]|uniref:Uncharacterized protein n=1 Tax=Passalora fulva TaxID=5499 RepID=A0A9Q8LAI3_PASFU|nr:uncharacterized protein CLAFUR5_02344 [Fulvia fulva]KAK4631855.1 hypothetical protein CLAFUR4_02350 [Fulvia fulva]KAK4633484.1 hypothetical protein CLAFUR0_02354 [Fulvia fulva]UJO13867.1 hypothetical protein CLAFUR5_02344 [Fulvia fulva]WPV11027.1 hypothetical protein CLAFUW4_02355 [Fulvia fulva]WPV26727.1 hypothetical protein CLAFUW7_02355 [Fulvia fulva]